MTNQLEPLKNWSQICVMIVGAEFKGCCTVYRYSAWIATMLGTLRRRPCWLSSLAPLVMVMLPTTESHSKTTCKHTIKCLELIRMFLPSRCFHPNQLLMNGTCCHAAPIDTSSWLLALCVDPTPLALLLTESVSQYNERRPALVYPYRILRFQWDDPFN